MKKLICFPFAGGGASVFYNWQPNLNVDEVIPIVLPGREHIISESPLKSIEDAAYYAYFQVKERIQREDTLILFGHCFGGLVAFEFAKLFEKKFAIKKLIISSSFAPSNVIKESFSTMSDSEIISFLETKTGMHSEAFEYEELRNLMLIPIRADLHAFEKYSNNLEKVNIPITAIHASDDNYIQESNVKEWEKHTSSKFLYKKYKGNHMYITENSQEVFNDICNIFI